jgi:hypothetical protein
MKTSSAHSDTRTKGGDDRNKEQEGGISCDPLVEASKLHRCFLRNLHKHGITLYRPSYESFRRYSQLWLPFVQQEKQKQQQQQDLLAHGDSTFADSTTNTAGNSSTAAAPPSSKSLLLDLIPPPDIAWLWHCHRLAPYRYAKYIQQTFSTQARSTAIMTEKKRTF